MTQRASSTGHAEPTQNEKTVMKNTAKAIGSGWRRCKTLLGSGIYLKYGALSLDMPPIGVAIVKLEK